MNLEKATKSIEQALQRMDSLYGAVVFDEWAIVSLHDRKERVVTYSGPRKAHFETNLVKEIESLREEIFDSSHGVGDFEFARDAGGTHYDALLVLNSTIYLICNNTSQSMDDVSRNAKWLKAQVPFVELSDKFRSDPLAAQ